MRPGFAGVVFRRAEGDPGRVAGMLVAVLTVTRGFVQPFRPLRRVRS